MKPHIINIALLAILLKHIFLLIRRMSFSTSNPEDLQVGQTYTFTPSTTGTPYPMTFFGKTESCPVDGRKPFICETVPLKPVYDFSCSHLDNSLGRFYVWVDELQNGIYQGGSWSI